MRGTTTEEDKALHRGVLCTLAPMHATRNSICNQSYICIYIYMYIYVYVMTMVYPRPRQD